MGTRHLICVVKNNEYRVAQYGQWDGYFEGQGKDIVEFLCRADLEKFSAQVDKIRILTPEEVEAKWNAAEAQREGEVGLDPMPEVAHFSRDCGSDILDYILDTESPEVFHNLDFAGDSLFCEYAYVVNLDTQSLEVYKGFNKEPLAEGERFFGFEQRKLNLESFLRRSLNDKPYYPVKIYSAIPFKELNSDTMRMLNAQSRHKSDDCIDDCPYCTSA
jgi:hypothetical protein